MKRELKFRVWNGAEMEYNVTVGKFGTFYVNPANNGIDERDSASLTPFNTKYRDDIAVMQYTGLKDKNDKEIFEGDILKVFTENGEEVLSVVRWGNEYPAWTLDPSIEDEEYNSLQHAALVLECEVIGNIYGDVHLP